VKRATIKIQIQVKLSVRNAIIFKTIALKKAVRGKRNKTSKESRQAVSGSEVKSESITCINQ
jgi:hypothetical protein